MWKCLPHAIEINYENGQSILTENFCHSFLIHINASNPANVKDYENDDIPPHELHFIFRTWHVSRKFPCYFILILLIYA